MGVAAEPRELALATPQASATEAGRRAFEQGGNAFDACLAAALSLTVTYPDNCALGGDLIALVRRADGSRQVINASGPAAVDVDVESLRRAGDRMPITGAAPVTVPGLIAGLSEIWTCGARLGWDEAFVAAIAQARDGVTVVPSLAASIASQAEALERDPGCREVFLRSGSPLREGDLLRQPALARTLERLAADGPEAFYNGPIGRALVAGLRAHGSSLRLGDLASFVPERSAPETHPFGDLEVATAPPNSQGFLLPLSLAAALRIDPRFDPLGPDAGRLARIFRAGLTIRARLLGDPIGVPPRDRFDPTRIDLLGLSDEDPQASPPATGDTVAIVAADNAGNSISLLQSLFHSFGAVLLDPETGILVHNRGTHFSLDPGSPNVIAGGKRPAHTLAPCMVFEDGRPRTVIATMGGSAQPQILTEVLLSLRLGNDPVAAVGAPRWVVGGLGAGDPFDLILAEEGVGTTARESLESAAMPMRRLPELDDHLGHTQLICCDEDGFRAASDPRSEGAAIVVRRGRQV